ncbi:MAG: hypothetical protein JW981_02055 [Anaerolineae bacterium]|nr:hypothetical protein [Anaerolineae bacterium]
MKRDTGCGLDLEGVRHRILHSEDVGALKELVGSLLEELSELQDVLGTTGRRYYVCRNWEAGEGRNTEDSETAIWGVCYDFMGSRNLYASTPYRSYAQKLAYLLNLEEAGSDAVNCAEIDLVMRWIIKGSEELASRVATASAFTLEYGDPEPALRAALERVLVVLQKDSNT